VKSEASVVKVAIAKRTAAPNTRLTSFELVVDDGSVDAVIAAIKASAATGKIGDGKIWVAEVSRLVRIRTGEEGPDAI
jgi:nitrogen regulatory protein PII